MTPYAGAAQQGRAGFVVFGTALAGPPD